MVNYKLSMSNDVFFLILMKSYMLIINFHKLNFEPRNYSLVTRNYCLVTIFSPSL